MSRLENEPQRGRLSPSRKSHHPDLAATGQVGRRRGRSSPGGSRRRWHPARARPLMLPPPLLASSAGESREAGKRRRTGASTATEQVELRLSATVTAARSGVALVISTASIVADAELEPPPVNADGFRPTAGDGSHRRWRSGVSSLPDLVLFLQRRRHLFLLHHVVRKEAPMANILVTPWPDLEVQARGHLLVLDVDRPTGNLLL